MVSIEGSGKHLPDLPQVITPGKALVVIEVWGVIRVWRGVGGLVNEICFSWCFNQQERKYFVPAQNMSHIQVVPILFPRPEPLNILIMSCRSN